MGIKLDSDKLLQNLIHYWWVILVCGIVGTIISYLISFIFLKPTYVAESRISVSINFKQVGHLSQYEQDQMIGNISSLFQTSETIQEVVNTINDVGLDLSNFSNSCFLERQVNEILFRCKSTDPSKSQTWSNTWAKISYKKLNEAFAHALEYEKLLRFQNSYQTCVEESILLAPAQIECDKLFPPNSSSEEQLQAIKQEFQLSKNIHTGFVFSDVIPASLPDKPVRYQTNTLVILGSIFGIFLSIFYVSSLKYEK